MKAAIAIDTWKLPVFEAHLKAAGFEHTTSPGLASGTLMLVVETERGQALAQTVLAANKEAAHKGEPK